VESELGVRRRAVRDVSIKPHKGRERAVAISGGDVGARVRSGGERRACAGRTGALGRLSEGHSVDIWLTRSTGRRPRQCSERPR